jgi:hypothetical protein
VQDTTKIKIIPVIGIILMVSIMMLSATEQVQARSYLDNFANGYEAGKDAGRDDAKDNNEHNSICLPNDSLMWCAGYEVGYIASISIEDDQ